MDSSHLLWAKAFDAFEMMFYAESAFRRGTLSSFGRSLYRRNYESSADVRQRADYLWKVLGSPSRSRDVAGVALTAGAQLAWSRSSGATRRAFLTLVPAALAGLELACGGSETSPTSPTTTGQATTPAPTVVNPTFLQLQIPLLGLLRGTRGSGDVVIPGKGTIPFRDGVLAVETSHQLTAGTYRDVQVIPQNGVNRTSSIEVSSAGILVDVGYKKTPLDYVDDFTVANKWAATRYDSGLTRVDSMVGRLRVFFYDNSRWGRTDSGYVKISDSAAPQDIVESIVSVVNSDLSIYTNGAIPNGGLVRESSSNERPDDRASGWLVFLVGDARFGIDNAANGLQLGRNGDVTNVNMLLSQRQSFTRAPVSYDVFESLFGAKDGSYRPIDDSGYPNQEVALLAKIQYNRKLLNRQAGGMLDYQD